MCDTIYLPLDSLYHCSMCNEKFIVGPSRMTQRCLALIVSLYVGATIQVVILMGSSAVTLELYNFIESY